MRDSQFFGVESKQLKNLVPENEIYGGDSRVRTDDLLNAIQALYQLSYTPTASLF